MSAKTTISIFGIPSKAALQLLQKLAKNGYRMLFIGDDNAAAKAIVSSLSKEFPEADLELVNCSIEGCWEADVIFILSETHNFNKIAHRIKIVSTRKLIVLFKEVLNGSEINMELAQTLPFCKIVSACWSKEDLKDEMDKPSFSQWVISGSSYEGKMGLLQIMDNLNLAAKIIGDNIKETSMNFTDQTINF